MDLIIPGKMEANIPGEYVKPFPSYGTRWPIDIYKQEVIDGFLGDDDGYAYASDGKMMTREYYIPSKMDELPTDATHVIWMNND